MTSFHTRATKVIVACIFAIIWACGLSTPQAQAAQTADKVVVSVERQTIGQGYLIEPTVVTFDEFIEYWAKKGVTVTPEQITAGGVLQYALEQNGTPMGEPGGVSGPGYMASIKGADTGVCSPPQHILDEAGGTDPWDGDSDLSQFDYKSTAGWMYTEHNWCSSQSMGSHTFYTYGVPYEVAGDSYYVVRLQFTLIRGDIGFMGAENDGVPMGKWPAADKSKLYAQYAVLNDAGFFESNPEARTAALAVMEDFLVTSDKQATVDAAYEALVAACHAEAPTITQDVPTDVIRLGEGSEPDPLTLEASVSAGELSYEWFSSADQASWTSVGTGALYTPKTDQPGTTYYKCVVTNNDATTGLSATAESSVATVIVGVATPTFSTDLSADPVSYLSTDTATPLSVEAVIDGDGALAYQWYMSADQESWEAIEGATEASFTPDVATLGTRYYRCRATNTLEGKTASADSATATIKTVVDTPTFDTNLRTRTYYPALDEELTLEVEVSVRDGGALSYQWYRAEKNASDGSVDGMEAIEGATDSSLQVDTSVLQQHYYRCVVTNEVQGERASVVSNWSRVQIAANEPYIEEDLDDSEPMYVPLGSSIPVSLAIEASTEDGGTLSYQWYAGSEDPGWDEFEALSPIEGATDNELSIDAAASGVTWYGCRVTNTITDAEGNTSTAIAQSLIVKVVVSIEQPAITAQSDLELTYEPGAKIEPLFVEASPAREGDELSYQWYQTQWGVDSLEEDFSYFEKIEGATNATYTPEQKMPESDWVPGYGYVCRVTATRIVDGKQETSFVDSEVSRVAFAVSAPVFKTDLSSETVRYNEGDTAEALAVEVAYEGDAAVSISYQWYCDDAAIEGATGASYAPATDENHLGTHSYHCVATAAFEGYTASAESAKATVRVQGKQQEISTEEELRAMKPAGNYLLTADIELTSDWTPLANFEGILDGGGHVISGINITRADYSSAAFFTGAGNGAVIKNLGIKGSSKNSMYGASSLVGSVSDGGLTIQDCFVAMDVTGGEHASVGGIVCEVAGDVTIERCYFTGTLTGGHGAYGAQGGLLGTDQYSYGTTAINDSYTTADKAVGAYKANTDPNKMVNSYSAAGDNYAKAIPGDMDEFLTLLNGSEKAEGAAYASDEDEINGGYPILAWQVTEDIDEPETPGEGGEGGDADDSAISYEKSMAAVLDYLQKNVTDPQFGTLGGEWSVLAMARAGVLSDEAKANWLANLYSKLDEAEGVLSEYSYTEYSRVVMALSSIGVDPTDVNGYDVLAPLADQEQVGWQGINGTMWALLALDACNYDVPQLPADAGDKVQTTRMGLMTEIIDSQLEDGGWTLWGSAADSDLTAMAIQALAPYYGKDIAVTESVDRAIECLSKAQLATGGFGSMSFENPNSTAQVIIALATLDPSLLEDERFIKDGNDMIGRLLDYQLEDGSFTFMLGDYAATNAMVTDQAAMALNAYDRALKGKNDLFDMTDVNAGEEGEATAEEVEAFKTKVAELPALEDCRIAHRADVSKLMAELDGMGSFEEKDALRAELQGYLDAIDEQIDAVQALDNDIWAKIDPNNVTLDDAETVRALMRRYEALPMENRRYVEYAEDLIAAKQTILRLEEEQKNQADGSGSSESGTSGSNSGTSGAGGQNSPLNAAGGTFQGGLGTARKASAKSADKGGDASFEYSVDDNGNVVVEADEPVITTEMLAFVAGKDQNLVVAFETEMGVCRVTVNGMDLDPETLTELDLSILAGASNADEIRQLAEDPAIFTFKHAGAFPVPMMFELPVELEDGTYLMLSYDTAKKGLDYEQKVTVENGVAKFVTSKGGTYALAKRASTETLADGAAPFGVDGLASLEHVPLVAAVTTGGIAAVSGAGYVTRRRRRAQHDSVA